MNRIIRTMLSLVLAVGVLLGGGMLPIQEGASEWLVPNAMADPGDCDGRDFFPTTSLVRSASLSCDKNVYGKDEVMIDYRRGNHRFIVKASIVDFTVNNTRYVAVWARQTNGYVPWYLECSASNCTESDYGKLITLHPNNWINLMLDSLPGAGTLLHHRIRIHFNRYGKIDFIEQAVHKSHHKIYRKIPVENNIVNWGSAERWIFF